MNRLKLHQLDQAGAADGQGMVWSDSLNMWVPATVVQTLVPGTNVTIDDTDPANPIISASTGGGGGSSPGPFLQPGAVYPPSTHSTGFGSTAPVVGRLRLMPLFGNGHVTTLDAQPTAVTTSRIRLGLYGSDSAGRPSGAPLVDAGTITATATGIRTLTFTSLAVSGITWLAVLEEVVGGGNWTTITATTTRTPILGNTAASTTAYYTSYVATGVTVGALPNPLPAVALSTADAWLIRATAA